MTSPPAAGHPADDASAAEAPVGQHAPAAPARSDASAAPHGPHGPDGPAHGVEGASDVRTGGLVPLHPAAVVVWRITGGVWAAIVGAVAITVCALTGSGVAVAIAAAATVGLLALSWALPPRRYRRWRYAIGDDSLEIHRGVWMRTSSAVPFHRIQQIDVTQGPLQRRHGVVTLQLRTAAAASDGVLPHLDAVDATALRTGLLRVAARSAADDGH